MEIQLELFENDSERILKELDEKFKIRIKQFEDSEKITEEDLKLIIN